MILIYWKKLFYLKCIFFLYEKFQSQVGNKVMCEEMDPYSKPFYLFQFIHFLEKESKGLNVIILCFTKL